MTQEEIKNGKMSDHNCQIIDDVLDATKKGVDYEIEIPKNSNEIIFEFDEEAEDLQSALGLDDEFIKMFNNTLRDTVKILLSAANNSHKTFDNTVIGALLALSDNPAKVAYFTITIIRFLTGQLGDTMTVVKLFNKSKNSQAVQGLIKKNTP